MLFVKMHRPAFQFGWESFQGTFETSTQTLDTVCTVMEFKRTQEDFNRINAKLEKQLDALHRLRVQVMHAWNVRSDT